MTTIAYNHGDKEIAVDGRSTNGSGVISLNNKDKSFKVGNRLFIMCGCVADAENFVQEYPGPSALKYECCGIMIENGVAYLIEQESTGHYLTETLLCDESIGSGASFALAAMDFGKSAKEAVKYAMTRDVYTGGKIRVFKVK